MMVMAKLISIILLIVLFNLGNGQQTATQAPNIFQTNTPMKVQSYPPTTTPPNFVNPCQFSEYPNQNSPGGYSIAVQSLTDCQSKCQMQSGQCAYGFDFNSLTKECWVSTNSQLTSSPGVTHYSCFRQLSQPSLSTTRPPPPPSDRAACVWTEMAGTNTPGGTADPASNLGDCQARCLAASGCPNGLDWVMTQTTGPRCFISNSKQLGILPGVSHYSCVMPPKESVVNSANRDRLFISGVSGVIGFTLIQLLI